MKVALLSKPFTEHRHVNGTTTTEPAHWFQSPEALLRFYPALRDHVPHDLPTTAKLFHCPDCKYIAIVPQERLG